MRPSSLFVRRCALILAVPVLLLGLRPFDGLAQRAELLTRAERTGFQETSSYEDVLEFLERVAEDPSIHLTGFGYTSEGRALPLAIVTDLPDPTPQAIRASGKTVVYLQGNIHAGEVCGKEALQMLLADFAGGRHREWTRSMILLVAPIYNADGNERVSLTNRGRQHGPIGGMGQRPNAQGYDLNRDHMKLDSPEARSVARLLTEYDPHVAVDLHTTNGTRHAYHLTYSPPLHPNTPAGIDRLLREDWLPAVTDRIRERRGWEYYYYGNAFTPEGGERGWYTFDHRPRFNNNYIGLRNRIAILSEAYSYATFEDRVVATLEFVEEILAFAHERGPDIRSVVAATDARTLVGDSLALRATFARSADPVEILMGEVDEEIHPLTGQTLLKRREVSRPESMYEFGSFRATVRERVPSGYLIPPDLNEILIRLAAHGVRMEAPPAAGALTVEAFRVDSVVTAEQPFQGRSEQELFGRYEAAEYPSGVSTIWVPADQPLGRLIFALLEPRSDDGFANWGFLADQLEPGGIYPIRRGHLPRPSR